MLSVHGNLDRFRFFLFGLGKFNFQNAICELCLNFIGLNLHLLSCIIFNENFIPVISLSSQCDSAYYSCVLVWKVESGKWVFTTDSPFDKLRAEGGHGKILEPGT